MKGKSHFDVDTEDKPPESQEPAKIPEGRVYPRNTYIKQEFPTRMELFEKLIRGLVEADEDPTAIDKFRKAMRSIADMIGAEHANLALYAESQQVQLAAIKMYYDLIGLGASAVAAAAKGKQEVSAEKIVDYLMREPVDSDGLN